MAKHIFIRFGNLQFDLANITVEPVLFLYMFANFLYFPTYQALIFNKVCIHSYTVPFCDALQHNQSFKDNHTSEHDDVTSQTSHWTLLSTIALTTTSFFTTILFLGPFGDKWGRKAPVMLPCLGALFAYVSALLNAKFMAAPVAYIIVGPILNGLCGGFIACLMAVYSYVGHISSPATKMIRVGIVEAMVFLAGAIGVFVSGVILEREGYVPTFILLCITTGIAIIYAALWLDNVHPPSSEMLEQENCGRSMLRFMSETFQCVRKSRSGWTLPALILQILVLDVLMLCTSGDMDISLLYLRESRGFSQTLYGYVKGLDNFLRFSTLVFILPVVKRLTTIKNLPLVIFGLISYATDFTITGLAHSKWLIFLAVCVGMFKGLPSAGLRATMSALVSTEEQGRLFGLIAASESVVSLLASLMFNELYPATLNFMPGLCYLLAAGLAALMILVVGLVHFKLNRSAENPYVNISDDSSSVNNDAAW
ncbi:proton-coupled folate transporter-like [Plakobranchus ocellatus]|uniref:Proton-coupled folate transporter-like n=1 Tax=Plakobranchus ocellatus TaxID=259542 RepID=A0AAV4AXM9_9GAST|nr:proton-coupled folate transporter-like [Plakobranchus ocellatus]